MKNNINRKEFLKQLPILGIALFSSGLFFQSCKKSETKEDPCADLLKLTVEEKAVRKEYEYVSKSPNPDQLCNNCDLWIEPAEGAICGGCELMAGPIHPEGYCNTWVEIS